MKAVVKYEKGENKIRYMDFEKPVPKEERFSLRLRLQASVVQI